MTKRFALIAAVFAMIAAVTLTTSGPVAAVSTNNDIANAIAITSLPFATSDSADGDTLETDEPVDCQSTTSSSSTRWYTFTATADTTLKLDSTGGWAFAWAAVYTGGPVMTNLVEVACAERAVVDVPVTNGTTYWLQVAAYDATSDALRPDIVLSLPTTIEGTVTHPTDGPIENVYISVRRSGTSYDTSTTTAADGSYSVDVADASFEVGFFPPAPYADEYFDNATSSVTATLVVTDPAATQVADASLAYSGSLAGSIRDLDTGALTTGADGNSARVVNVADTSADYYGDIIGDTFTITDIPPGTYALSADGNFPYGPSWSDGTYKASDDTTGVPHIVIGPSDIINNDIYLAATQFSGSITDNKSGAPIDGVTVKVFESSSLTPEGSTASGTDGTWSYTPTSSDTDYHFEFTTDDGLYVTEWYSNEPTRPDVEGTYISAGQRISGINAILTPIQANPVVEDQAFELSDAAAVDDSVGVVVASDPNPADTISFAITAGNDGSFAIDATTGEITVTGPLDADATSSYPLTVEVTDDEANASSATVTVTVVKDNVAPVALDGSPTVDETTPIATTVHTVSATDTDGDPLTYSIISGNDDGWFTIDATTGEIVTAMSIDGVVGPILLIVDVSDGELTDSATITISINDVPYVIPNANFEDVPDTNIFVSDIDWLAWAGVTKGCGADVFCPAGNVTRGQMAAFLARALNLPATDIDFFTDDDGTIFENDINRLAASGITKGCSDANFCPDGLVTRGQMAAFLNRAFGLPTTVIDFFADDDGTIFENDINELAASGITSGCRSDAYCADNLVTREQMAAFLRRGLQDTLFGPR